MRKRGQLTFDFVFAIIAFLMFLGFASTVLNGQTNEVILVQTQAKIIASNVAQFMDLNESMLFSTSSYKVPTIDLPVGKMPCRVEISKADVTVTVFSKDSEFSQDIEVIVPRSGTDITVKKTVLCGEKLV
ncbi:MAG: hypothetical protein V1847_04945 [Candidatus Diapherotrites archaeon]